MAGGNELMGVRRVSDATSVIDIRGEVTAASEAPLLEAFSEASSGATRAIGLNFSELEYMNSSGIGLLVTVLVKANRQRQRLFAYGLDEHYRQIFSLTRLDEAIAMSDTEQEAVAASEAAS